MEAPVHIVGACMDMCPERERAMRERLGDISVFERFAGNPKRTSKELAVKKFSRTVAGWNPGEVRPLPVLERTVAHLLLYIDSAAHSFASIYAFLSDRFRAVQQDLVVQGCADRSAIAIYEKIVRFYIAAEHEAYEHGDRGEPPPFDLHLNQQQMRNALATLLSLYSVQEDAEACRNEGEFSAYHVLVTAGGASYAGEELVTWLSTLPERVRKSPDVVFARLALRTLALGNYVGFFKLVGQATFLQGCLLQLHFSSIRATAVAAVNKSGFKGHPFPLSDLASWLALKGDEEVEELLALHQLQVGDGADGARVLYMKAKSFAALSGKPPLRTCPRIALRKPASRYAAVSNSGWTSLEGEQKCVHASSCWDEEE